MIILVKAKPNSKEDKVIKLKEGEFDPHTKDLVVGVEVWVKEPPVANRANEAILGLLAGYLAVPRASIHIRSGHRSRSKIVEIR